ncbi:hypothetical protein [Paenibacillus dendritiformis]|uniref:hypothetical protein n=1 Tax=Paenibacillus dendritiformis TaxID=130049 RepID=UPI001BD050C9|nr:hypothetical protein [Paenibacillus dendritiformis]
MSCSFAAQLAAAGEPIAPNRRFRKNNQERELQLRRATGRCRCADRAEPALPEEQPGA